MKYCYIVIELFGDMQIDCEIFELFGDIQIDYEILRVLGRLLFYLFCGVSYDDWFL